jgi:PQQ-dependent catabolism-associated beta-propeller protein
MEHLCNRWNSFRNLTGIFMKRIASTSLSLPRSTRGSRGSWLVAASLLLAVPLCAQASRLYVSNEDSGSVSVLDTDSTQIVNTVNVGKRPRGLKLSHDGKQLFVAVTGSPKCPPTMPDEECDKLKRDLTADGIAVIDTASLQLTGLLKSGSDPEQFDVSHDGKHLYVSNEDAATLSVVNIATGAMETAIPVGKEPEGVRVTPDGRWVVVTSESGNAIYIIDPKTQKMVKSLPVGKRPRDVTFSLDSKKAYISGEFDASLYTASIPGGAAASQLLQLRKEDRPMGLVLDAPRKRLYVSTGRGGTVAVVDLAGSKLVTEIQVGPRPWGIALSHDGKRLYTANGSSNDVSIVDTATLQVVKKIAVGKAPWGVALSQ